MVFIYNTHAEQLHLNMNYTQITWTYWTIASEA